MSDRQFFRMCLALWAIAIPPSIALVLIIFNPMAT